MYSEQMMREQGFDAAAELPAEHAHRRDLAGLPDHPRRPDAPRRDRRRRGDPVPRRADELRGAERPGRGPPLHVHPDLPAVVPARQGPPAPAARRRAGAASASAFSLRDFHDTLLAQRLAPDQLPSPAPRASGSPRGTAGGAERRAASGAGRRAARAGPLAPDVQVIPSIDLDRGRSRVVFWPGASTGVGAPTDRPDRIAESFVERGARLIHLVDFDGARTGAPGQPRGGRGDRVADRDPAPGRRRRRHAPTGSGSPSRPARRGS